MPLKEQLRLGRLEVTGRPSVPTWSWRLKGRVLVTIDERVEGAFVGRLSRWVGEENRAWEPVQHPWGFVELVSYDFDKLVLLLESRLLEFLPGVRTILYPPPGLTALERVHADVWVV